MADGLPHEDGPATGETQFLNRRGDQQLRIIWFPPDADHAEGIRLGSDVHLTVLGQPALQAGVDVDDTRWARQLAALHRVTPSTWLAAATTAADTWVLQQVSGRVR